MQFVYEEWVLRKIQKSANDAPYKYYSFFHIFILLDQYQLANKFEKYADKKEHDIMIILPTAYF